MFILISVFVIAVCFGLSFFWSCSEMALTSLSKLRVKKLIATNKSLASPLHRWLKAPYYLLTIILTGGTITDMALTFLSTAVMITAFNMVSANIVEFITWLITAFLAITVGDLAPKIIARENAEAITIRIMPLLSKVERLLEPIFIFFEKIVRLFIPNFKMNTSYHGYVFLSGEEIDNIMADVDKSGVVGEDIGDMLERTLSFGTTSAYSVMTPLADIEAVDINKNNEEFLDIVIETSRSRVPVYSGTAENIQGYIHIKDILLAIKNGKTDDVKSLIKPAYFVERTKKINFLMKEFQSGTTHIGFVKDRGKVIGMVTLEDIIESITGEIMDEYELEGER